MKFRDIHEEFERARRGRRLLAERSQLRAKRLKLPAFTRAQLADVKAATEEELRVDRMRLSAHRVSV
jgi:hypothetical protein